MLSAMLCAAALSVPVPGPFDKDGWGLRVRGLSSGPYLVGEDLSSLTFEVELINFSKETRYHDPLDAAVRTLDLGVTITQPNGKPYARLCVLGIERDPDTRRLELRPGRRAWRKFCFTEFGYDQFRMAGRHQVTVSLKVGRTTVTAPSVDLDVIDIPVGDVLASRAVSLSGFPATRLAEEQDRPFVQQVRVGNRVWLLYRRLHGPKYGGGVDLAARLVELSGPCGMTVAGTFYEDRKPLTVMFKPSPNETKTIRIHPIDGRPWRPEDGEPPPDTSRDHVAPLPRTAKP